MVWVDELRVWGHGKGVFAGRPAAHLTVDNGNLEELHAFAERIGLKRKWFQGPPKHRVPHYDLTETRYSAALKAGAVFVPAKEQARKRLKAAGLIP